MATPLQRSWARRVLSGTRVKIFRRPIYIVWLSLLAVALFAFTFAVNRLYARKQQQLSVYWFQQGQNAIAESRPDRAISDLRTALVYSHDNEQYLFTLAQALEAAGYRDEARSYLLTLLQDEPGSGAVNLELAHLAETTSDVDHAMRYFNAAIYGAWDADPVVRRQQARRQLISFLVAKGLKTQANGELLTFTAEMPRTAEAELWVAQTFSQLGDDNSALRFYLAALRIARHDPAALFGAGKSAFRLGRYTEALEYFRRAAAIHPDEGTTQVMQLTSLVLELNPFESRISDTERRHRLTLALDVIDHRLQQCSTMEHMPLGTPQGNLLQVARSQWIDLDRQLGHARSDADLVQLLTPVANLINTVEQQSQCGSPGPSDEALLRIYQNSGELQP